MPRLHLPIALCALLGSGFASGCTTAADLGVEPQLAFEADDPDLPDEVSAIPTSASAAGISRDESPSPEAAELPLTAYANTAADNPAAAAIAEVRPAAAEGEIAARSPELDALIARYAGHHGIPLELLRRVVNRESTFNPAARNGPYWGLMQIHPQTARTMGYHGPPEGLLDAETNLIYAGKYLRGAYLVADGDHDLAVRHYSRGYYYHARDRGMLEVTGLGKDRHRTRMASSH